MGLRLAVLASGRGSNFEALLKACRDGRIDGTVHGLFSNKPDCGAVALAHTAGVPVWARTPKAFPSRDAFEAAMFDALEAIQPDLIICAGYMLILGTSAIARFPNRMLNLHPSLLPLHPGLHTHARALAAGDAEHGASVHVVTPELDAGPVLAQVRVPVFADDTTESLGARVQAREHALLLACVAAYARGEFRFDAQSIHWRGEHLRTPLRLSANEQLENS